VFWSETSVPCWVSAAGYCRSRSGASRRRDRARPAGHRTAPPCGGPRRCWLPQTLLDAARNRPAPLSHETGEVPALPSAARLTPASGPEIYRFLGRPPRLGTGQTGPAAQ
jgi:hypothetical protein